jgi:hypothetical protein
MTFRAGALVLRPKFRGLHYRALDRAVEGGVYSAAEPTMLELEKQHEILVAHKSKRPRFQHLAKVSCSTNVL